VSELPGLPNRLLNMQDVAEYLDVSLPWVKEQVRFHRVPCSRIGKHIRFTHEHVAEIIKSREETPANFVPPMVPIRSGARSRL
jgi:excisionase family DNA binding protein